MTASLEEVLGKYETIEGGHCVACGNRWYFDKGRFFTCTTCDVDKEVYSIEEENMGKNTIANIRSDSPGGLERGLEAYLSRFPADKYTTTCGPSGETLLGKFYINIIRNTEEFEKCR